MSIYKKRSDLIEELARIFKNDAEKGITHLRNNLEIAIRHYELVEEDVPILSEYCKPLYPTTFHSWL